MQYNYQHFGVPRIDYVDSSHDRVWGWADPGATVDVHVHGVKHENVVADGSGRWNLHIGQERGNHRVEVRQMKTGRPWSGMAVSNVVQLPALGNPSIDQMNTAQDHGLVGQEWQYNNYKCHNQQ